MKHLQRNQQFQTVKQALKRDNPSLASSMERMADSVSASLEIISGQLGYDASKNPSYVIPMALEIFKDSENISVDTSDTDKETTKVSSISKLEQAQLDILEIMSDPRREWDPTELDKALNEKEGGNSLSRTYSRALLSLISDGKIRLTDSLGFQRVEF